MFFEKATTGVHGAGPYVLTIIAVILGYAVLGQIPLSAVMYYQMTQDTSIGISAMAEFGETMDFSIFNISSNFGFFLMISIFIITLLVFVLCIRYIHRIPLRRLVTPLATVDWRKVFWGFAVWLVIGVVLEGIMYLRDPSMYTFSFSGGPFIVLVLMSIFLLPLQTSCEELFFRGYLMPGIGLLARNKWVPLIVTSILFGLVHGMNPEVEKFGFWTMQFYYISAGLFLGLITILDDSLELALGVHAATNIFGATLLSFEGSVLQTGTLFSVSSINPLLMTAGFYVSAVLFVLMAAKKYNWPGYTRLMEPVGQYEDKNNNNVTDQLIP